MLKIIKKIFIIILIFLGILMLYLLFSKYLFELKDVHSSAPKDTQFVTLKNGDEIAYQEIDNQSSTTIIFVGGLSGWSGTWRRSVEALNHSGLKQKYNMITIDVPPFGYSTAKLDGDVFLRDKQAERINGFREVKHLDTVIFVAHSYGAGVTAEAVMQNQEGVKKFVIIDGVLNVGESKVVKTGFVTDHLFIAGSLLGSVIHIRPAIKNRLQGFVFQKQNIDNDLTDIYMQSFGVRGTSKKFALWLRDYIIDPLEYKSTKGEEYSKLKMPMRIIWGKEDTLTPVTLGHDLVKYIPTAKLYVLENVGHIPMIEDYQQFDSALLKSITE